MVYFLWPKVACTSKQENRKDANSDLGSFYPGDRNLSYVGKLGRGTGDGTRSTSTKLSDQQGDVETRGTSRTSVANGGELGVSCPEIGLHKK
jgi:hypothetical protein